MWREEQEKPNGLFWKLLKYSLDGIVAFSTVPLSIASILGLLLCFYSICINYCNRSEDIGIW